MAQDSHRSSASVGMMDSKREPTMGTRMALMMDSRRDWKREPTMGRRMASMMD